MRADDPNAARILESCDDYKCMAVKTSTGESVTWRAVVEPRSFIPLDSLPILNFESSHEILQKTKGLFEGGSPHRMRSSLRDFIASDDSPLTNMNIPVCIVNMWGFSDIRRLSDPLSTYAAAVEALVNGRSGTLGLAHRVAAMPLDTEIVLHVPASDALEPVQGIFGHSLMAPYVAKALGVKINRPVHLVMTRCSTYEHRLKLFERCALENTHNKSWNIRTHPFGYVPFYPNFSDAAFASSAVLVRRVTLGARRKGVVSEMDAMALIEQALNSRIVGRCCLCVGGDVKELLDSMMADELKFDMAVHVHALALEVSTSR
jgi:hypothetical protein